LGCTGGSRGNRRGQNRPQLRVMGWGRSERRSWQGAAYCAGLEAVGGKPPAEVALSVHKADCRRVAVTDGPNHVVVSARRVTAAAPACRLPARIGRRHNREENWTIVQNKTRVEPSGGLPMDGDLVEVERAGHVLVMTLNRPKVNAIDRALSRAIYAAARQLQDDPALRGSLITAKGERVFSAGWDFREAMQRAAAGSNPLDEDVEFTHGPGGFAGLTQFWDLTKPIVAAVNGAAVGGGFELALATDVIVMAENAY